MTKILLEPGNPADLRAEKLKPLIEAIRNLDSSYEVHLAYKDKHGYCVTWWEVLSIWIPWATITGAAAKKIVELAIDWAHRRLKGEEQKKRPRHIAIYGPNGEVIKEIRVDHAGHEEITGRRKSKESRRIKPPLRE